MAAAEHMRGVGGEVGRGKYQPRSHKQRRRRRRRCDRRASKRLLTWQAAAVAARKGHAVLLPPGGGRAQQRCLLGGSLPRELPQFWRAHRTAVSIRIHAARMAEPVSGPWVAPPGGRGAGQAAVGALQRQERRGWDVLGLGWGWRGAERAECGPGSGGRQGFRIGHRAHPFLPAPTCGSAPDARSSCCLRHSRQCHCVRICPLFL